VKQLTYSPAGGGVSVEEVPAPGCRPGCVLVRTVASVVSSGTERMALEFAQGSLLQKARSRPDIVHAVLDKARREGLLTAIQAIRSRLDRPASLGYSSAGVVLEVGSGVTDLHLGDRVACAGAGYAAHAEIVCMPRNLVTRIPEPGTNSERSIDFEEAAFATLGAVAMHGLRLGEPQLGETVAVIGLGLIGMLTVQLARAAGCAVIGMDPDEARCRLAEKFGCDTAVTEEDEFKSLIATHTGSTGADVVILAAATPSDQPVKLAAEIARSRGRVIAVGAISTNIPRNLYYEKELLFRVSRSYGPGRYDQEYEEKGHDYPLEYVRWTENRNLQSFLRFLAQGRLDVRSLITHRFAITEAWRAYDLVLGRAGGRFLGIVISYPQERQRHPLQRMHLPQNLRAGCVGQAENLRVGLLGAGNFALGVLIPAMRTDPGTQLIGICAASGLSAQYGAKKFGFLHSTTDPEKILKDPEINTAVVATPHRLHASLAIRTLAARKNVFCEKPLCVSEPELAEIVRAYEDMAEPRPLLTVGFNRRFAPMASKLKEFLGARPEPLILHYRVNAGPAPLKGWIQDRDQGGRVVGEICHFVDFFTFLVGESPVRVHARQLAVPGGTHNDNVVILLEFANGSLGTITYVANGDKSFPKERLEVFAGGSVGMIDDFRRLELVRNGRRKVVTSRWRQDKGHQAEWQAFATAVKTGKQPIPWEQMLATTLVTFRILESLQRRQPVEVRFGDFIANSLEQSSQEFRKHSPVEEIRPCSPVSALSK